jgi:hypothetical protein
VPLSRRPPQRCSAIVVFRVRVDRTRREQQPHHRPRCPLPPPYITAVVRSSTMSYSASSQLDSTLCKEPYLCSICFGITQEGTRYDPNSSQDSEKSVYFHQSNVLLLQQSAEHGCTLCKYIFDGSGDCYSLSQKIGRYVGTRVSSLTRNLNQKSKAEKSGHEIGWRTGSEDGKSP